MLEIEVKCPVSDLEGIRQGLAARGAVEQASALEADHYFNAPDRDFAQTDEALRLRRIGTANLVTYKGPKQPGATKTRSEIEVPIADGQDAADDFCNLLEHLGYRPTAVVRKRRIEYHLHRDDFEVFACLDDVEEVGRFIELEIVAPENRRDAAQEVVTMLCRELGLEQIERRSYLEMLLEKKGARDAGS